MRPRNVVRFLVTAVCAIIIIAGDANTLNNVVCGAVWVLFLYWSFALGHWFFRLIEPSIDAAMTPVPSPQEIELELRRQGHDPSLQDVAAIHQMLATERNQAVGTLAATVGVMYVIRHA